MGGQVTYSCSVEAKDRIPRLLRARGIQVDTAPLPDGFGPDDGFKFVCSRGGERIQIAGVGVPALKRWLCVMTIDHSLAFAWRQPKDIQLLEEAHSILEDSGMICRDPPVPDGARQDQGSASKARDRAATPPPQRVIQVERRKPSRHSGLSSPIIRAAVAYPLLWLYIAFVYDPSTFTAWLHYPHIVGTMALGRAYGIEVLTEVFMVLYPAMIAIAYALSKRVSWWVVFVSCVISLFIGTLLQPL